MRVEDGSGLPDADSYTSVTLADTYHGARGNQTWITATNDQKNAALVRACDYLERGYGSLWPGARISAMQRLSFPRYGIDTIGSSEIPEWLVESQCEAALLEILDPGTLSCTPSEGGVLSLEREGEMERRYAPGPGSMRRFPSVHGLLTAHIRNPSQVRLGRT